jgi:PHD/YefM family antitoxin component YafN of YafNO toxin-antitoxin module
MTAIHPQYITDTAGQKLVVLPLQEFDAMIEELEELEDIKMYDKAKKEDDGERVLFSDYLKNRKAKNA